MTTPAVHAHFESFVRQSSRSLFSTAYLLTGNSADSEELLQDVLVALLPKWEKVMAADSAQAYVRKSLINRFVSLKRSRRSTVSWTGAGATDSTFDPVSLLLDKDLMSSLLLSLPPKQRAAIVLRFFDDATDSDISQLLGCRVATVRSLISRGLAAMRNRAVEHSQHDEGAVQT